MHGPQPHPSEAVSGADHALAWPTSLPTLEGDRVRLRALTEDDLPAWFARATDAESADLAGDPVPTSIAAGAAWLARQHQALRAGTGLRWAIVRPAVDAGASVGTIGLTMRDGDPAAAELGVVVARAHWNQGVAEAAACLVLRYAFDHLGLTEVQAEVLRRNPASQRLLEKVGFERVAEPPPGVGAVDPDACVRYLVRRR